MTDQDEFESDRIIAEQVKTIEDLAYKLEAADKRAEAAEVDQRKLKHVYWVLKIEDERDPAAEIATIMAARKATVARAERMETAGSDMLKTLDVVNVTDYPNRVDGYFAFLASKRAFEAALSQGREEPGSFDPDCVYCGGSGLRLWHSDDCNNDNCALNGDMDSCPGQVEPCPCWQPNAAEGAASDHASEPAPTLRTLCPNCEAESVAEGQTPVCERSDCPGKPDPEAREEPGDQPNVMEGAGPPQQPKEEDFEWDKPAQIYRCWECDKRATWWEDIDHEPDCPFKSEPAQPSGVNEAREDEDFAAGRASVGEDLERYREALESITKLNARGPHESSEDAHQHALSELQEARRIARAALQDQEDNQ